MRKKPPSEPTKLGPILVGSESVAELGIRLLLASMDRHFTEDVDLKQWFRSENALIFPHLDLEFGNPLRHGASPAETVLLPGATGTVDLDRGFVHSLQPWVARFTHLAGVVP